MARIDGQTAQRNIRIMTARVEGKTLDYIAQANGITRERVRQILRRQIDYLQETPARAQEDERLRKIAALYKTQKQPKTCQDSEAIELAVSIRAQNVLKHGLAGVTIKGLASYPDSFFLSIPSCGRKVLKEIRDAASDITLGH